MVESLSSVSPAIVRIDAARTTHTMASGAGASWHAIGPDAFWYPRLINRVNRTVRGSGFGGNPPLDFADAWGDIFNHAKWLGLSLIRAEFDLRMFAPSRGRFDWDNQEMQTLYRILDFCQQHHIDVFLTHMWQDVEWNSFDGIPRVQSAPRSVPDFVHAIASLVEKLVRERKYTCIRWLCISNEPGFPACWWMGPNGEPADVMPAVRALRAELDRRDLQVAISGPDWCDPAQNTKEYDLDDQALGSFDVHNYRETAALDLLETWTRHARARGIPFIQSESGSWNGDNPFINPVAESPKQYNNQLLNAEKLLGGINVGVDGFIRWNFVNRGDLDGQWQLLRTWDASKWEYLSRVEPEPVPYYAYGILTRFLAKRSAVLDVQGSPLGLLTCAVQSPKGHISIYQLNRTDAAIPVKLSLERYTGAPKFHKYQVTQPAILAGNYRMNSLAAFPLGDGITHEEQIPPQSITVYSTYHLNHDAPGIIADE